MADFLSPHVGQCRDDVGAPVSQVAEGQRSTGLGWDESLGRKSADTFPGRGLK